MLPRGRAFIRSCYDGSSRSWIFLQFICDKHKEWEDDNIKRNPEHVVSS